MIALPPLIRYIDEEVALEEGIAVTPCSCQEVLCAVEWSKTLFNV